MDYNGEDDINIDDPILLALCNMFFGCNIPFSIVDDKYFREFVHRLNPNFQPPTRKTLAKTLLKKRFTMLKKSIKEDHVQDGVLLIDGWKNKVSGTQNVVAMVQTTSGKNFVLDSWNFSEMRETGEELSDVINQCIEMSMRIYNVRLYAINTDNAANMKAAAARSPLWNVTCNSHSGNLLFNYLVDRDLKQVVTNITKDFKTPKLQSKLTRLGGLKMVLYGDTRWCSIIYKHKRCLQNLPHLRQIQFENDAEDRVNMFNFSEGVIEALVDNTFDERLLNEILILDPVCKLVNKCQRKDATIADATEHWMQFDLPVIDRQFEEIFEGRRDKKVINKYGLAANYLCHFYKGRSFERNEPYRLLMNQFFEEFLNDDASQQELQEYATETGRFAEVFRAENLSWKSFWRLVNRSCPNLSRIAILLLGIPASTANLERLFSEWTLVHSKLRNKLLEERSTMLAALYFSLRLIYINNNGQANREEEEEEE